MNSFNRFAFANTLKMTSTSHSEKPAIVKGKTWPGTRPPVSNPMLEDLKMDASWGRGKFRDEIWEDQLSPLNEWWRAYEPSDEEYEAIALGYDFTNAKQWFEVRTAKELLPSPPLLLSHMISFSHPNRKEVSTTTKLLPRQRG